jgi:4-alpha-glucanotransferase
MKVLQFAFLSDGDQFLPHCYESPNLVVYPGTHDNDTTVGWWQETSTPDERAFALRYLDKPNGNDIAWDLIRLAWGSIANRAIATAQDLLSLGSSARMNVPSRAGGNWQWRYQHGDLSESIGARLHELTVVFGRAPVATTDEEPADQPGSA